MIISMCNKGEGFCIWWCTLAAIRNAADPENARDIIGAIAFVFEKTVEAVTALHSMIREDASDKGVKERGKG